MSYLLDTCVVSELSKKRPDKSVLAWLSSVAEVDLYVSSLTIAEIRSGIERFDEMDSRRARLENWYENIVASLSHRIISFDHRMAVEWGRIVGASFRTGRVKPDMDMLIAATAKSRNMTLVTRNTKDMEGVGVDLLNPFEFQTNERK